MLHRRHHSIRVDEKFPHHVTSKESKPQPELDLYRSTLTIDSNGSRELNRLGAKSRWRISLLETEMDEKHAELAKEKLGWFDREKQHALEQLKEQIAALDKAKGDVLRNLGLRMEDFFDFAIQVHPVARSFDVRIDRFDNGRIEAILFVDEDRASRVLVDECGFEQAIEHLKKDLDVSKMEYEGRVKGERDDGNLGASRESTEATLRS